MSTTAALQARSAYEACTLLTCARLIHINADPGQHAFVDIHAEKEFVQCLRKDRAVTKRIDYCCSIRCQPSLRRWARNALRIFVNAQTEFLDTLQETNREWFDRMQSEANLTSEFASKLTAARSIPEAIAACQEWTTRRFELIADDGKRLLADTQKFMETGARLLSSGWLTKSGGGGT